jgi:hypothetical protein
VKVGQIDLARVKDVEGGGPAPWRGMREREKRGMDRRKMGSVGQPQNSADHRLLRQRGDAADVDGGRRRVVVT